MSPLPEADPNDGTQAFIEAYGPCRDQTEVVLYKVRGGGHAWPGGRQYAPVSWIGRVSRDFDACEAIWKFFKRHAKAS
jgi:polyhydroxybutyrate depolymerase